MNIKTIIGGVLVTIGIMAFAYQGIVYTSRDTVVEVGNLTITADKTKRIPIPPVVGAVALVGGVAFLLAGLGKR